MSELRERLAASICLLEPSSSQVLIGRRLTEPWLDFWAFPGGKAEPGESLLEAGCRELAEETGIRLDEPTPVLETALRVEAGDVVYALTNFCVLVPRLLEARPSDELEPRWVALEEAATLRPMARGTRTVIERVTATGPWG